MRALDPNVIAHVWTAVQALIPAPVDQHPLGCHRPRIPDQTCFRVLLVRLVTGCSWEDAERLCGNQVSDTAVRTRRDAWIAAGVFDTLATEALAAYDRIIGLDFTEVAIDGILHKAPTGGEGTGKNPTDRAKCGWKWSILTDRQGIPMGWAIDAANRHDLKLLEPMLTAVYFVKPDPFDESGYFEVTFYTPSRTAVSSAKSRRCGSTGGPKRQPPWSAWRSGAWTMSSSRRNDPEAKQSGQRPTPRASVRTPWASAGPWNGPTPGWPTLGNSAATPTGKPVIGPRSSLWR